MNKGLWFIELLEDDLTPGSATLSPVRGQFNDTGLAREQVRDFSDAALDFTHYPPPRHQPWHQGNLENFGDGQEEK